MFRYEGTGTIEGNCENLSHDILWYWQGNWWYDWIWM